MQEENGRAVTVGDIVKADVADVGELLVQGH